ncbi:helicase [Mortierella sp. NVP85]|nr:helicase [Mortierella sp. NVP85]
MDVSIAKGIKVNPSLNVGDEISFAGRDIEIQSSLDPESYRTGRCFMPKVTDPVNTISSASRTPAPLTKFKAHHSIPGRIDTLDLPPQPRHNPDAPGAILLPRPPSTHPRVKNGYGSKRPPGDAGLVDVVVDPLLGQHLRPHQKEGVRFLYECVMEMKDIQGQGAILADEMGLGKTLQTIALLWTLLKQSPYHGEESSVVKKALVVCPASLIKNWQKEFKKWLGTERVRVFAAGSKSIITDFTLGKIYPVMVIGYEKLRMVQDELKNANFDIIICDEGHRLKAANIKTAQAIRSLSTKRRIILSGTPIQNDLGEFFSMIDFVNPGLFESYNTFKRVFEDPILRSRQPGCTPKEAELGLERYLYFTSYAMYNWAFPLRGNHEAKHPCDGSSSTDLKRSSMSSFRGRVCDMNILSIYALEAQFARGCFTMDSSRHLACITALRKLCNSPKLILERAEVAQEEPESQGLYSDIRSRFQGDGSEISNSCDGGKLSFVEALLNSIHGNTSERVVLVSNFTQTLDLLEALCIRQQYGFFRLDGSTPTQKRQEYVDKFNEPSCRKCKSLAITYGCPARGDNVCRFLTQGMDLDVVVFLLSAKSGGVGLNLIGASRLVMFDIDWNPSVDLQAMARIHRDGQSRPVYIYRLLLAGTIEEKMYQRQLTKVGLSDALIDAKSAEKLNKFSIAELRDLFTFHEDEACLTHSLLGCECHNRERETRRGGGSTEQVAGDGNLLEGRGMMDQASASVARKELEEWIHVNIQGWKSTRIMEARVRTRQGDEDAGEGEVGKEGEGEGEDALEEKQEEEGEEEEGVDDHQHGWNMDTLATKDKVLWNAIVQEGIGEQQLCDDKTLGMPVSFAFVKCGS